MEGTLSQVIRHVSTSPDDDHTWKNLGYQHSYEFRTEHTSDTESSTTEGDGDSDPSASHSSASEDVQLEAVPGIGPTRAEALRKAGFNTANVVASASLAEIQAVSGVGNKTATCLHVAAREACGYENTPLSEMATELGVEREAVTEAYAVLAPAIVTPEEAKPTIEALFAERPASVVNLDDTNLRFTHFLRAAGFETIEDVASASISELTEASYVGSARAKSIREEARETLERAGSPSTTGPAGEASEQPSPAAHDQTAESQPADSQEASEAPGSAVATEGTFPAGMKSLDQWVLWKPTEDGRKVPRAPWQTNGELRYVNGLDPANWTSFNEALEWREKYPADVDLAFALTAADEFVFLDLDDVVQDGNLTRPARKLIDRAGSYGAVSTSGTGVHLFGTGQLSEGVKSITGSLGEGDQSLEVYDRNRFVATTGNHIEDTPTDTVPIDDLLEQLEEEYATVPERAPDSVTHEPRLSREELATLSTTDDIQDIFDAIAQTRPSDIHMRSRKTAERADGSYDADPSWTTSESGTRLAVLEDGWIYREGMHSLDALQLVALEEGIITDEQDYPEGEDFWDALEALRDRGAVIPRFEPGDTVLDDTAAETEVEGFDREEIMKRLNYGRAVRSDSDPTDLDYQERTAIKLAPRIIETAEALELPPAVAYRTASVYAAGHAAGVVKGDGHEATLGAAFRVATTEAGTPRPLEAVAEEAETSVSAIRTKFSRLVQETAITDEIDASDLVVDPIDYVPYLARKLGVPEDGQASSLTRELLEEAETGSGASPVSEVAGAFYVALKQLPEHATTQEEIAKAAGVSSVTVRNNARTFKNQG